jgi:predicted ATP-dependent endonuclease of OLD family
MHITEMTIEGGPPFNGLVDFEFDERVNVFVGPNSTGKTSIIKTLSHPPNDRAATAWQNARAQFRLNVSEDWPER